MFGLYGLKGLSAEIARHIERKRDIQLFKTRSSRAPARDPVDKRSPTRPLAIARGDGAINKGRNKTGQARPTLKKVLKN